MHVCYQFSHKLILISTSPGAIAGAGEGARAAGVAGALFGVLVAASSVMWAVYKFKPGLLGGAGARGAGGGGATSETVQLLNISQPRPTTNYKVVDAATKSGWVKVSAKRQYSVLDIGFFHLKSHRRFETKDI